MCLQIRIDSGVEEMKVLRNTKFNSVELVPLLQILLVPLNLTARGRGGGLICYRFPNSLKHRKPNFLESIFICEKEKQKATLKI